MPQTDKSTPRIALDHLPAGTPDLVNSNTIPQGITSREIYADVFRIAWPALVELTLTQLASMVDMMMVGRLGSWAITAVGLTTQPKFLLMTMFMALNVGATAMVARYKGAGRQDKANLVMRQALLLTLVLSALSSVLGYTFARPLLVLMGAQNDVVLDAGVNYFRIQMIGFVPMALTTTITATLRGVGNTKTPMVYNLIANIVNVCFNYMMIYGHFGMPRLEVAGASWATIIGQFVAFLLAVEAILSPRQYLRFRPSDGLRPDLTELKNIFEIGLPAMLEQFIMRAGMMLFARMVADLGELSFATHQVCMNIQAMSFMLGQSFANAATSLVGQSLGKVRGDMAGIYSRHAQRLGMAISFLLLFAFFFFGGQIVSLYNDDPALVEQGKNILRFIAVMQPLQASQFILAGALRGAGDTRYTAVVSFLTVLLVRPGVAAITLYLLHMDLPGAWVAMVCDQLLRTTLIVGRYRTGKWKTVFKGHTA